MTPDFDAILRILDLARARGDDVLVEPDGFPLLKAIGIVCPRFAVVADAHEARRLDTSLLSSDRIVVKVASSRVFHRSDVGGVAVVANRRGAIVAAVEAMERRFPREGRLGFTLNEFVPHDAGLGTELLLGLRWTDDFGPVVTLGAGGIYAEFLARSFRPGDEVAILPAFEADRAAIEGRLARLPVIELLTGGLRRQAARTSLGALADAVEAFAALGRALVPERIAECEVNPLAVGASGGLVALDVLVRLGRPMQPARARRPLHKLANLLVPERVAIVGVSEGVNPGHIILDNLLREGFSPDDIVVVKRGTDRIGVCRCVPDLASIPGRVDLLILAVSAAQVPGLVTECIARQTAESLIVIPGGLEEKAGTADLVAPMYAALDESRATPWQGPIINGGNCLGIRSLPGGYDTMFIPASKMPVRPRQVSPVALIAQSGAFAVAKSGKLAALNPKFIVTVGNQMDLTVGDYLTYLASDEDIDVFAVYVEGFRRLDGLRLLSSARQVTARGGTVVLYRAGRTAAGAVASASHTASIAGDYAVTRELAASAGVIVADTLADFEDLVLLFAGLRGRSPAGGRLGAVSNAGFECVAMADNLGALTLATLGETTRQRLADLLRAARIDTLVDVHNPLDLTPMAGDAAYEQAVRVVLEDASVDVGLVGCVPLTPALNTLARGEGHRDDVADTASIASRLARLFDEQRKPWVVAIDGGRLYDPMAALLETAGVPVFRNADRALRLLDTFCAARQRNSRGDRAPAPHAAAGAAPAR
jgi:acyl-CoA synthetase (NDP forming)